MNILAVDRQFKKYILFIFIFFIVIKIFDGALRYYLPATLILVVYTPIIFMGVSLFILMLHKMISLQVYKSSVVFFYILIIVLITASIYVPSNSQVLFGIYTLIPFIFGFIFSNIISGYFTNHVKAFFIFLCMSTIGVFGNLLINYPWTGFIYTISGIEIEASRQWSTHGIERLAGFSRSSFSVAIQIALFSITVIIFSKHKVISLLVWWVSLIAILLTTTKGIIVTYIFISLLILFIKLLPVLFLKALPIFLVSIMILFPLGSVYLSYLNVDQPKVHPETSLIDRVENTWPNAYDNIVVHGNILLGRGIGGIGEPQVKFGEKDFASPADNMSVYIYSVSGLLGIVLLIYLAFISNKLISKKMSKRNLFIYLILILIFTYGITTNVIEAPILSLYFGVAISYVLRYKVFRIPKFTNDTVMIPYKGDK